MADIIKKEKIMTAREYELWKEYYALEARTDEIMELNGGKKTDPTSLAGRAWRGDKDAKKMRDKLFEKNGYLFEEAVALDVRMDRIWEELMPEPEFGPEYILTDLILEGKLTLEEGLRMIWESMDLKDFPKNAKELEEWKIVG